MRESIGWLMISRSLLLQFLETISDDDDDDDDDAHTADMVYIIH